MVARFATAVNGQLPAPVLRIREGDTITLRVKNNLAEASAVHWHCLLLPPRMDGVPSISFPGIAPGDTFTYRFPVRQTGTYWYHGQTLHEPTGLYGAIVAEPRDLAPAHHVGANPTERESLVCHCGEPHSIQRQVPGQVARSRKGSI